MLHFYRYRYQGNEGVEEIYVACIDNKDLAEVIMKDMNADTEESAPLEENALIPLLNVGNDNTSTQLNKKTHTHDYGSVDSIPRVSCEERGTLTPLEVVYKNPIFDHVLTLQRN